MADRKAHWESLRRDKTPLEVSWQQEAPDMSSRPVHNTRHARDAPIIDVMR